MTMEEEDVLKLLIDDDLPDLDIDADVEEKLLEDDLYTAKSVPEFKLEPTDKEEKGNLIPIKYDDAFESHQNNSAPRNKQNNVCWF